MKTTKRRMEIFSFYNHTGIESHLSKMAKKGWMIESITNLYWTYRKIEPMDIHFSVSYYPRASDFDPEPTEEQKTFHDFCAHTGWQYACSWFQMQIFYNERENPIPLDTDPITEVDTMHRACKKNFLIGYFVLLAIGLAMSAYSLSSIYVVPIDTLSSPGKLMILIAYLALFALSLVELVTYFTWYRKAQKAAQDGLFVDTPNTSKFQIAVLILLLFAVLWWFSTMLASGDSLMLLIAVLNMFNAFGVMFLVTIIKQGLKKAKASRGLNKFLTFAACFILPIIFTFAVAYFGITAVENDRIPSGATEVPPLPLSITDFHDVDESKYILQNQNSQTLFMGHRDVYMSGNRNIEGGHKLPNLQYSMTTVHVPFLYERCKAQMYRVLDETDDGDIPEGHRMVYKEMDAGVWGAREAYQLYQEEGWYIPWYLVCYDDTIIEIRFNWEPTAEDMSIVNHKLNP